MENKAFTLVELLAVITILAIIAAITTPVVINIFGTSKQSLNETQKKQIIEAARMYGTEHLSKKDDKTSITIGNLQNEGYLDDKTLKDLTTNNNLQNCKINIIWENNQLTYKFNNETGCPTNE